MPPYQSQEAPTRQSAALPHPAALDTSGSCFSVLIIPLAAGRTAAPPDQPITPHSSPTYTSISSTFDPRLPGLSIIDLIHNRAQDTVPFPDPLHHINRQDIQVFLSVATCPDQVESINSWISGICKDYSGIFQLGAIHPEHLEAEILWVRQPGIKGMNLHGQRPSFQKTGHHGVGACLILSFFGFLAFIGKNGHENSESRNFQYLQSLITCRT